MNSHIANTAAELKKKFETLETKRDILKAPELKALYAGIKDVPADQKRAYGQALNELKEELEAMVEGFEAAQEAAKITPIDLTAPFDVNVPVAERPAFLPTDQGSRHPLTTERQVVADIFARMGYEVLDSRQLDDDYHMFGALNFPEGHPARDDYDTFVTEEGLIAPAHTSTMQNRVLKGGKPPIRAVVIGRVFRNEDVDAKHDLDARHEHTFYQLEGVYVDKGIHAGNLMATFKTFLSEYYQQNVEIKSQPFYFPFTEPSFELALSCPFCQKKGCNVCSYTGWIELLGMGMIHPNVLREAGIDPNVYTGFAWGGGIERLVMMKYGIEDIRYFESGKLEFLRQFV